MCVVVGRGERVGYREGLLFTNTDSLQERIKAGKYWKVRLRLHRASRVESSCIKSFDEIHFDASPFTPTASIQDKSLHSDPFDFRENGQIFSC